MNDGVRWGQSTAGVLVIQGLIGPVMGAVVGAVVALSLTKPERVDWGLIFLVAFIVALVLFVVLSLALGRLRRVVWGAVRMALAWVGGLRINTRKGRSRLREAGYAARSREVEDERKLSPRPRWRVTYEPGEDWIYLHNSGYWVSDVVVRADPDLFEFADGARQGGIQGRLGGDGAGNPTGRPIQGRPTKRGEREGVTFTVSWTDQNGDAQPTGDRDDLPSTATLPSRALQPVVQPTWQIGLPRQSPGKDVLMLANGAQGFEAKNLVIDADPIYFTFVLKRELGDLEGIGGMRFVGRPTEAGRTFGVVFTVTYQDVNDEERTDYVPVEPSMNWGS